MPTLAEIVPLQQTLASVLAGEPRRHQALTVVPLMAPMEAEPAWLTLAEAGDRVRITEVSEGGSVPDLRVANLEDLPLLLLAGEQLVGAKQNRILTCPIEPAQAVGLGAEYRLAGDRMAGATLVAEERVVHLMAFPIESAH